MLFRSYGCCLLAVWSAGGVVCRGYESQFCPVPLDLTEEVGERRMLAKLTSIMENISHPSHDTVGALSSSFSSRLGHQCVLLNLIPLNKWLDVLELYPFH